MWCWKIENDARYSAIDDDVYDYLASQLSYLRCARSAKVTRIAATCCNGAQQRGKESGGPDTRMKRANDEMKDESKK